MGEQTSQKPSLVPLPKFFAVVGFTVFSVLACLVILETSSWVILSVYRNYLHSPLRRLQAKSPPGRYSCRGTGGAGCPIFAEAYTNSISASPAFIGYPWAEDFWKEFRAYDPLDVLPPYEAFRLWGTPGFQGKYINNDETEFGLVRRTVNKLPPGCHKRATLKIWFFGGSTAWGEGAPDFATIPSYLSQSLNAQGTNCVEVTNLGVDGYDTNQELIYLTQELKAGRRPDLAVFYDGYNDAYVGAYLPALAWAHEDYTEIKRKFESSVISWPGVARRSYLLELVTALRHRLTGPGPSLRSRGDLEAKVRATLDNYEWNLASARTLGVTYGFEVQFFWQPALAYGGKPMDPFEKMEYDPTRLDQSPIEAVYAETERRSAASGNFVFLGKLFSAVSEPLFVDWVHLGPRGNEMVADAIARVISSSQFVQHGKREPGSKN